MIHASDECWRVKSFIRTAPRTAPWGRERPFTWLWPRGWDDVQTKWLNKAAAAASNSESKGRAARRWWPASPGPSRHRLPPLPNLGHLKKKVGPNDRERGKESRQYRMYEYSWMHARFKTRETSICHSLNQQHWEEGVIKKFCLNLTSLWNKHMSKKFTITASPKPFYPSKFSCSIISVVLARLKSSSSWFTLSSEY